MATVIIEKTHGFNRFTKTPYCVPQFQANLREDKKGKYKKNKNLPYKKR